MDESTGCFSLPPSPPPLTPPSLSPACHPHIVSGTSISLQGKLNLDHVLLLSDGMYICPICSVVLSVCLPVCLSLPFPSHVEKSLARLGAEVVGVDPSPENVAVASAHAQGDPLTRTIRYEATTAEELETQGAQIDRLILLLVC